MMSFYQPSGLSSAHGVPWWAAMTMSGHFGGRRVLLAQSWVVLDIKYNHQHSCCCEFPLITVDLIAKFSHHLQGSSRCCAHCSIWIMLTQSKMMMHNHCVQPQQEKHEEALILVCVDIYLLAPSASFHFCMFFSFFLAVNVFCPLLKSEEMWQARSDQPVGRGRVDQHVRETSLV